MLTRCWSLAAAAALTLSAGAPAQDGEPFTRGTVLVVEHAALDRMLPDAKDRGMAEALGMLPQRVRELPREVNDPGFNAEAAAMINMIVTAIARPGRLAVTYNGDAPTGGFFGYGVAVSILAKDKAEIDQMQARIGALLAKSPPPMPLKPSTRFKGMTDVQLPVGLLSFGPREAADGWRYEIIVGTMDNPDAVVKDLPPASRAGFEPVLRASFNSQGLMPAFNMVQMMAGQNPEAAANLERVRGALAGGLRVTYESGFTQDASVSTLVYHGAGAADGGMMMGTKPLTKAEYGAIPVDAVDLALRRGNDDWLVRILDQLSEIEQAGAMLQQFQQITSVNLRDEVAAAIGGTTAFYMSDSTGGGGLGSAVGLISVLDRAKLGGALNKLTALANAAGEDHARGYVRIAAWSLGGAPRTADMLSLRFPGLPVPLEFTIGLTDRWLVIALTPQAASEACRQAMAGDDGILANPKFKRHFPADRPLVGVSFSDTERAMHAGYTLLCMAGSAVGNLVRSPTDPARNPPMTVPVFGELRRGVQPRVSITYWRDQDLVTESRADRSALVNVAGGAGSLSKLMPVIAAAAAATAFGVEQQSRARGFSEGEGISWPLQLVLEQSTMPLTPRRAALLAVDSADWLTLTGNRLMPAPDPRP
jgi:hypothetical protein